MEFVPAMLFCLAGLMWVIAGNIPVGMMFVVIGMMYSTMAISNNRRK